MAFASLGCLWPRPRPRHDEQNHSPSGTWLSPTHAKCASFSQPSQRSTRQGSEERPQTMHVVSLMPTATMGALKGGSSSRTSKGEVTRSRSEPSGAGSFESRAIKVKGKFRFDFGGHEKKNDLHERPVFQSGPHTRLNSHWSAHKRGGRSRALGIGQELRVAATEQKQN